MACALTSESRRLYSWWWDSHVSPKSSKWLQENLTDMDTKVKSMIKLIEIDADSFARRAEMYYKKRPELMKLVEEFYRAYRALAERYDYATSELRHAHKTLQAAFPDLSPETCTLLEELSSSMEPDAQKNESFGLQFFIERLKKAVADLIAEKDSLSVQYQFSLEKLSNADGELNRALEKSRIFEEKANEAEKEVDMLKKLSENDEGKISALEKKTVATEEEAKMFAEQAVKAEMEVEKLKTALLEVANEKEALRVLYTECLEKSKVLELDLSLAQSDVQRLTTEILNSTKKLKHVEEVCIRLEASNQCLKMEVIDLAKKNMLKDQELSDKHDELKNTEFEFVGLKQMKERLEEEVALQSGQCVGMQKEIFDLKEEITKLNTRNSSNHESFGSSVKYLEDEKSALVLQKTVLEDSLSAANIELENLRERSKGLEELCEMLNNEKSNLLKESVQKRLEVLENRFTQFEKEKEAGSSRMLELVSATVEKQEHESRMVMDQKRLDDLESILKKEELQEELEKAVIAQFENFILHKFVKEVEEENRCLSVEIGKHIEASKLADKLISELETEILEQQVEEELLLIKVENLRMGIYQVFLSLGIGSKSNPAKISTEEIVGNIKDLKRSLLKEEDDKQRLLIENIVISTLLNQLKSWVQESEVHKEALLNKYESMKNDFLKVKKENLDLSELNGNLGLELVMLEAEMEEREAVKEILTSEIQERENELELCNAEATKFVCDLQVLDTRGILFESKVHELAVVCESLEGENAAKDREIEEMKRKAGIMEREIEGLKAQLLAYTPVIGSLKDNVSSLEHTVANLVASNNRKAEDVEVKVQPHHNQTDPESALGPKSLEPNGISDLIEFQKRIAALEKVIVEDINTFARRKTSGINIKPKPVRTETEESKSTDHQKRKKEDMLRGKRYLTLDNLNIPKPKPEFSEMRDIPLDQASDGSPSTNSRSRSRKGYLRSDNMLIEHLQVTHKFHETENKACKLPYEPQIEEPGPYRLQVSNQESKKGKLLQRLASDAHKLANLKSTVKDLTKRLEACKQSKKSTNGVDFKIVKEQLEEAEETIVQLTNVNVESTANVEKNPSLAAWLEQSDTLKRSERIKTVQLDVQNIQSLLMKLDDEKKSKGKSRVSTSKSRTSVILRDFIHRGGRSRRRRLCGCFTQSMTKGDRVKS